MVVPRHQEPVPTLTPHAPRHDDQASELARAERSPLATDERTPQGYEEAREAVRPRPQEPTPTPAPEAEPAPLDPKATLSADALADKEAQDLRVGAFRARLKQQPQALDAERERPVDAAEAEVSAAQVASNEAHEANAEAEIAGVDPLLFPERARARRRARLTHLGLMGDAAEPARLAEAAVDAHGREVPGDRALVLQRVSELVNQLVFVKGLALTREDVDAMTAELTRRVLAGRVAQQYLGDVATYWRHFQVERLSRDERRALRATDPEALRAHRKDRLRTVAHRLGHRDAGELAGRLTGGRIGPGDSPPPGTVAALVGTGEAAPALLEPWILAQTPRGPAEARAATGFDGAIEARVDTVKSLADLEATLAEALAPLGLAGLPGAGTRAPELATEPAAGSRVDAGALEAAEPAEAGTRPDAFLTAVYQELVELVLGVHAQPDHHAPRLRDLRVGDRVPVTRERREAGGRTWARALVDAPEGGPARLGWLDTAFTNEARVEAEAPQRTLLGVTPSGLTVVDYLRPAVAGAKVPVYAGVYAEDTARPVGELGEDPAALVGKTADNDPDFVEVLHRGRPVHAPRAALRVATDEERLLHRETLSALEIARCRAFVVGVAHGPTRQAWFERLQRKAKLVPAAAATVVTEARRGPLAALGLALETLGVASPYPEAGCFADALEMVRLERGLPEALDAGGVAALARAFGVGAEVVAPDGVSGALGSGQAVLAVGPGAEVRRVVGRVDDGWEVDDPVAGRRVTVGTLEGAALVALAVAVEVDRGEVARQVPRLAGAEAVREAFTGKVFGATPAAEEAWYLGKGAKVHGEAATAGLKGWRPEAAEVAGMPPGAQGKAFRRWMQARAAGLAGLAEVRRGFVEPLGALGGDAAAMRAEIGREVEALLGAALRGAPSEAAYQRALGRVGEAKGLGLLSEAEAARWHERAEGLRPARTTPEDDDFAALWVKDARKAGGAAVEGALALGAVGEVKPVYSTRELVPFETTCTVKVGNVTLVYRWTAMTRHDASNRWLSGWMIHGVTVDGERATAAGKGHHWALVQEALGASDDELAIYRAKGATEGGELGHFASNTYDRMHVTMGLDGLAGTDYGHGCSLLANAFGQAMRHDARGEIGALLASVGVRVRPVGGDAKTAQWFFFEVDAADGKTYSERSEGSEAQVRAILAAYGRDPLKDGLATLAAAGKAGDAEARALLEANVKTSFHADRTLSAKGKAGSGASNLPQLVMRYDVAKLAVMNALMADPRVQAAITGRAIAEERHMAVNKKVQGGHSAYDYIWAPLTRYCYAYTSDHLGKREDLFAAAFAETKARFAGVAVDDPAAWTQEIEDFFRGAYAPRARKAGGKTLADVIREGTGDVGKLSAARPKTRPADAGAALDLDGALALIERRMEQARGKGPQEAREEPAAPDRPRVIDGARAARLFALEADVALRRRVDAVHASEAGARQLDAFVGPARARLMEARPTWDVMRPFELLAAHGSWALELGVLARWAMKDGDAEAFDRLVRAADVALDVAARYPALGTGKDVGPVDPKGGKALRGGGEPAPPGDLSDLRRVHDDPKVRFSTSSPWLYVKRDGRFDKTNYLAGRNVPYRLLEVDGDHQALEVLFQIGNMGDNLPAGSRVYVKAGQAAAWRTGAQAKALIVGSFDDEVAFMEAVGGGAVASELWTRLRQGNDDDDPNWGKQRGYVERPSATYCNHLVIDALDNLAHANVSRAHRTSDMFTVYEKAPPKDFQVLALPDLDLHRAIWDEHVNRGELVFILSRGDLKAGRKAGEQDAYTTGHIALAVPTKGVGSRKVGDETLTFGNVIQAGYNMGYIGLTGAWTADDIAARVKSGNAKAYRYTGPMKKPSLGGSTVKEPSEPRHVRLLPEPKGKGGGEPTTPLDAKALKDPGAADALRQRFPGGVVVALSIPDAFQSGADAAKQAKGPGDLDPYAFRYVLSQMAATPADHPRLQRLWSAARKPTSPLPADVTQATKAQRNQIAAAMHDVAAVNAAMFADTNLRQRVGTVACKNNLVFQWEAKQFASAEGAVAADRGKVELGRHLTYRTKDDIPKLVASTSAAVAALLAANPATPARAAADAQVARVRFLALATHGSSGSMHGRGAAAGAHIGQADVPSLVSRMARHLSSDVRVRLFACSTAAKQEGGMADAWRDALHAEGKREGAVIGHTTYGPAVANPKTRFFSTASTTGANDWRAREGSAPVFDDAYAKATLTRYGRPANAANLAAMRQSLDTFFSRECWMEDATDVTTLRQLSRARFERRYPTEATLKVLMPFTSFQGKL